jgi:hypothetical protein
VVKKEIQRSIPAADSMDGCSEMKDMEADDDDGELDSSATVW